MHPVPVQVDVPVGPKLPATLLTTVAQGEVLALHMSHDLNLVPGLIAAAARQGVLCGADAAPVEAGGAVTADEFGGGRHLGEVHRGGAI